jgi:signal recognition particle GTPase
MASLDTRRPAAQEQLKQLGEQTGVATLPIIAGQSPTDIAARAVQAASSAAMTWSFSTPPAVRTSTSR